jgi:hypothetical protein
MILIVIPNVFGGSEQFRIARASISDGELFIGFPERDGGWELRRQIDEWAADSGGGGDIRLIHLSRTPVDGRGEYSATMQAIPSGPTQVSTVDNELVVSARFRLHTPCEAISLWDDTAYPPVEAGGHLPSELRADSDAAEQAPPPAPPPFAPPDNSHGARLTRLVRTRRGNAAVVRLNPNPHSPLRNRWGNVAAAVNHLHVTTDTVRNACNRGGAIRGLFVCVGGGLGTDANFLCGGRIRAGFWGANSGRV